MAQVPFARKLQGCHLPCRRLPSAHHIAADCKERTAQDMIHADEAVPVRNITDADKVVLMVGFARIDLVAIAVATGTVCALALALLTAALLVKGAPPSVPIGTHLGLLAIYLPGYSVSWGGSVLGALYGWMIGAAIGSVWAILWNLSHYVYIALVVIRSHWWRLMAD